ncbi:MAG: hypothetical protein IKH75_20065 [Ruminococcus sp.]|nr:hypothetical protein [Ruminococcus sp.]
MNKLVKAISAIAAAAICAVPMMSTISANAAVPQDYAYFDFNEDGNINSEDTAIMESYIIAQTNGYESQWRSMWDKYGIDHFYWFYKHYRSDDCDADINHDGKVDSYDARMLSIAGKYYPSYKSSSHPNQNDFIYSENNAFIKGDANGDGVFNIFDAIALEHYLMCPVEDTPAVLFDRSNYYMEKKIERNCKLNWDDYHAMLKALGVKNDWQGLTADKSTLEKFMNAIKNGDINIENAFPEKILKGDTNGDGKVDMTDVIVLQQYLINPVKYPAAGNYVLNGNNFGNPDKYNPKLDIGDLVAVQMIVSGYKLSNGHVDINAKTKIKGKETYVFGYYYDIYQAQAKREGWNIQY